MKQVVIGLCVAWVLVCGVALAEEEGWIKLFNGKDLEGWERKGGKATYAGKPHAPIYNHCLDLIADSSGAVSGQVNRERILVVGDGPKTDIRGALDQRFDSLFIGGGIHSEDCFNSDGGLDQSGMGEVFGSEGNWPTYAMPWLVG